jgi:hypothetical protein
MLTLQWEQCPNSDVKVLHTSVWLPSSFHVNRDTTSDKIGSIAGDAPSRPLRDFCHALASIDGIDHVSTYSYQCTISKGRCFAWQPIEAAVEALFHGMFDEQESSNAPTP